MQLLFWRLSQYQLAVLLSTSSMAFGILREFLIVGLLGFSSLNDSLQVYLSIFYTIGLTIDAMRLACLNLFSVLSLPRIVLAASLVSLPFATMMGLLMNYSTHGVDKTLLSITILGSYLNLIAALLITYKQRNNTFLLAQFINVLPNFILIPGIILCYTLSKTHLVLAIVSLTSAIPIVQIILLFLIPHQVDHSIQKNAISLPASILNILRHFSSMLGEQLLQIITRAAFFNYGPGYLSVFAMAIRIYAALRAILIDSYIGSKLANWQKGLQGGDIFLFKRVNSLRISGALVATSLLISLPNSTSLYYSTFQICLLLIAGFYFSTLVRIVYFKINRHENNASLVIRFASYEFLFFLIAFVMTNTAHYPLLVLLWIGYIAKPFTQLLFLRQRFTQLAAT